MLYGISMEAWPGCTISTSPVSQGMVACHKARGSLVLYALTPKGREIARLLKECEPGGLR